jgi:hypothetical protein
MHCISNEFFKLERAENADLGVRVYQLLILEVVQAATTAKLTSIGSLLTDYGSISCRNKTRKGATARQIPGKP